MVSITDLLLDYKNQINSATRILVGYSGGLDSSVMLAAAAQEEYRERILAVHINHQIHPEANQWEQHCRDRAETLGIHFYAEKVTIQSGVGIEEGARNARYQVFERLLGSEDLILLGHHADDQVETFLYRLFRGSGVKGLAAIPPKRPLGRGGLIRPLLKYSKQSLHDLAQTENIQWIEDPSNVDTQFDRNFIRNELVLLVKDRWTTADKQILNTVEVLRDTDNLIAEVAEQDLHECDLRWEAVGQSLDISALETFSHLRQDNLLRRLIYQRQGSQPNQETLGVIRSELLQAAEDSQPCLRRSRLEIRRFKKRLYMTPVIPDVSGAEKFLGEWPANENSFEIPGVWKIRRDGEQDVSLRVYLRRGGERLKPQNRDRSQSLKKLMLEYEVEPWLRDWMPVIYLGDEIVAIGDRIQCSIFRFQMQWSIEERSRIR